MTDYDNTNRFVMFENDQGGNPKRPQYRGSLNVNGTDYNLSAWIRKSKKDGSEFLSGTVEPKSGNRAPPPPKQRLTEANWDSAELNDELPPF